MKPPLSSRSVRRRSTVALSVLGWLPWLLAPAAVACASPSAGGDTDGVGGPRNTTQEPGLNRNTTDGASGEEDANGDGFASSPPDDGEDPTRASGIDDARGGGGTADGDAQPSSPGGEDDGLPNAGEDEPDPPGPNTRPPFLEAGCAELVRDPSINWRESSLQTDQEIVECLAGTLGTPIGFGENARGGYDPNGNSRLVVITTTGPASPEEQVLAAISGDEPTWIVFDKRDFAEPTELGLYRRFCDDESVLSALDGSEAECRDHRLWCNNRDIAGEGECLEQFFNQALNDGDLPIRNPVIGSHKTLDGRMSDAIFRFSGFAIGSDSSGEPVETSESVIITHLRFLGAGHTEDHELDPDMLRSTGASHDIWIHKNDFDLTGDSAFDVKVGAFDITMSFNRIVDVKRASLHGSSDSREINSQITTTMHHNAFVTRTEQYLEFGNTARRVPLIRRGSSHFWNNVFVNYRKDIISVRVGAQLLWEDNALLVNRALQEKDSLEASLQELQEGLLRDIEDGNFSISGTALWFSDDANTLDLNTETPLSVSFGNVENLGLRYSQPSQQVMAAQRQTAGQALVDYVQATAGKDGSIPFNSPLSGL